MDLLISDLQIAIFTAGLDLSNRLSIANAIDKSLPNLFEGNPTMLPIPDDAPAEIPRIIFRNSDSSYMMNVGMNRFDFYYHDRQMKDRIPTKKFDDVAKDIQEKVELVAKAVKEKINAKIVRVGVVPTFVVHTKDATKFMRDNFFNTTKVKNDLHGASFFITRRGEVGSLLTNIGVNGTAYRKPEDSLDNKIAVFNVDISTVPEKALDMDAKEVVSFSTNAFSYIKDHKGELLI